MTSNVLDGIKVLDLSQFLSGPRCSQLLAMKGAEVVKVEPPSGETLRMLTRLMKSERMLSAMHQNKKGVVIDMKKDEGRELIKRMAAKADIVVENFAPGLMKKIGLDYDTLCEINPGLIYVSISGFGRTGPMSNRVAFDIVSQASAGIMAAYKMEDRTPKVYFGDLISGAYAALGAVEALLHRERTGKGQLVDISMQDVMYFQNFSAFSDNSLEPVIAEIEKLLGRTLSNLLTDDAHPLPFWASYKASDGYVVIVALTDSEWTSLMKIIGREDALSDFRFSNFLTRIHNADEGFKMIAPWVAERTAEEVVAALEAGKVPCARVLNFEQVNHHPQLGAREMLAVVEDEKFGPISVPGDPVKLSECPQDIHSSCPRLGQHTNEVLRDWLGLSDGELDALKKKSAIA
ncbi:MAG: CoA transferase [bacterium]